MSLWYFSVVRTHMCADGEYPGLPCPLVSRWSREPLSSSWLDCNKPGEPPLSVPGGLPPSKPGGLPPNIPGGLPPNIPGGLPPNIPGGLPPSTDGSPPRRPWQLPPIGPAALLMRPGLPSKGREVSARAACGRKRRNAGN